MAYILSGGSVTHFAEYEDVLAVDSRVFEANEGLTDIVVEEMLAKSTDRIVSKIKASAWWRQYNNLTTSATLASYDVPTPDKDKFISNDQRMIDLCVFHTLKEYLYPKIADFGEDQSAEVNKIKFYNAKFEALFEELCSTGDFYDLNDDGTVSAEEKQILPQLRRRSRGRRSLGIVR